MSVTISHRSELQTLLSDLASCGKKNDDIATVRTLLFHSNRAGSKARLPERSDTITASLLKQPK